MDTQNNSSFIFSVLVLFFLLFNSTFSLIDQAEVQNHGSEGLSLSKLFLFGDSYLDTGNNNLTVRCWKFPYGMAIPGVPTGRYSDGLIFTDFLGRKHDHTNRFFKQYIAEGVYNKRDLDDSIAVVSNAGNDYTQYYAVDRGTHEGYQAFAAKVIDQLELNLREIRKIGVKKVVMLTMQPLGCLPNKAKTLSYEKCDKPLNNDTIFHNMLLEKAVQRLNSETTDSPFHILDLYGTFMSLINKQGGAAPLLKPCCTPTAKKAVCGSVDANGVKLYTLCENPNDSLFWDLYHPTQSGWQEISTALTPSFDDVMQYNSQLNIYPRRPSASVATS
ncbi:hypothetical protein MKW92_026060 [Papaver armeniacum]|nr:hypothetical protein MKW92_026060 [Papaver armeniacum]